MISPFSSQHHPIIGVCESIITYEQKASIPLIAMMYILHRQPNGKFLPLADFAGLLECLVMWLTSMPVIKV